MAAKKKASAKRRVKKAPAKRAAKRPAKKAAKRVVKKAGKAKPKKVAAKRPSKRSAKKASSRSDLSKIVIPPVPSRGTTSVSSTPATNSSSDDDDAMPTPTETVSEEPSAEPSESESEEPAITAYEAPTGFVAIRNASGGVTLRWKASTATDGLTGYAVSVSYNAVDFVEVSTVGADQLSFDIALASDEGGTQFLLQSVYSDGTKVDATKFSLKGQYQN
ncbi:MAG: hypothetical protein RIR72_440 [Actinomycetota bacterium]